MIRKTAMKRIKQLFFAIAVFTLISSSISWAKGVEIEENYVPDPAITAMIASNPQIIDDKLKAAMLKEVENPASITIEITHISPEDTALGKFKKIYVYAYRSTVEHVIVESAKIEFLDVIVKETDLNDFLKFKAKKIKVDHPKVKMMNNSMELSGSTKYGIVKVEFWAKGNFSIKDDKEIWFHASKMKVNRISMPRSFIGTIIKKINPLMNFKKFSFDVNLEQIKITEGQLRITSFPD